jgi:hypothetical protein
MEPYPLSWLESAHTDDDEVLIETHSDKRFCHPK